MDVEKVKKIREDTGAGVMDVKKALDEANGDENRAREILKEKGIEKAKKKGEREIKAGRVFSYIHNEGKVGCIVLLGCETDFVAKVEDFTRLGQEIAMQVAAMDPKDVSELLEQDYIRDSSKKIKDLVSGAIAKIGENITIVDIKRLNV